MYNHMCNVTTSWLESLRGESSTNILGALGWMCNALCSLHDAKVLKNPVTNNALYHWGTSVGKDKHGLSIGSAKFKHKRKAIMQHQPVFKLHLVQLPSLPVKPPLPVPAPSLRSRSNRYAILRLGDVMTCSGILDGRAMYLIPVPGRLLPCFLGSSKVTYVVKDGCRWIPLHLSPKVHVMLILTNQQGAWWCNVLQLPSEKMLWNPSVRDCGLRHEATSTNYAYVSLAADSHMETL